MMTLNGAQRKIEKIRRLINPPWLTVETEGETVILKWAERTVKVIERRLWDSL